MEKDGNLKDFADYSDFKCFNSTRAINKLTQAQFDLACRGDGASALIEKMTTLQGLAGFRTMLSRQS